MEILMGLAVYAFFGELWLLWQLGKLIWRFLLWITKPIRDEIAYRKMVKQEMAKELLIRESHQRAMEQIDQTVNYYLDYHNRSM